MNKQLKFNFQEPIATTNLSETETSPSETPTDEEEPFEFAFSIESDPISLPNTTADQILPIYPLFNRNLITQTTDELTIQSASNSSSSSSSIASDAKDLHRLSTSAPVSFAPPSPDQWRKSSSTGSSAPRKWKLRDLVGRSRSDGKEKFLAIPLQHEKEKEKKSLKSLNSFAKSASVEAEKKEKSGKKSESAKEMDIVTAHRIYYGKSGAAGGSPAAAGGHRRSFLPYRQELLGGIFGNGKHHHPF